MKKITVRLITAAVIFSLTTVKGDEVQRVKSHFEQALQNITDYQVTMIYEQTDGIKIERRTVLFSFRSPGWVRNDILDGKDEGSTAVYDPYKHVVYAKRSWMPFPLTLEPESDLVTTLRGNRINDASFPSMLARWLWFSDNGLVTHFGTENYEGADCEIVEFTTTQPQANRGVARELWWLESSTGFPVKIVSYDSVGSMVQWLILRGLKINPGLGPDYFRL